MASNNISIAELAAAGVALAPHEAVAIAQRLMRSDRETFDPRPPFGPPSPDNILLGVDGAVVCRGCAVTPAVFEIAILLQKLLPDGAKMPGGLRYAISRALMDVDAPPFATLADFSRALERYERGDRTAIAAALVAKAHATPALLRGRAVPQGQWVERRRSVTTVAALRRQLHEADRELYERRQAAAPAAAKRSRRSLRFPIAACVAAGLALLAAGDAIRQRSDNPVLVSSADTAAVAATQPRAVLPQKRPGSGERSVPAPAQEDHIAARSSPSNRQPLQPGPPAPSSSVPPGPAQSRLSSASAPPASSAPPQTNPQPPLPAAREAEPAVRASHASLNDIPDPGAPGASGGSPVPVRFPIRDPDERSANGNQLTATANEPAVPAYSPSFASNGTAIFFHTGRTGDRSSALRSASVAGSDLRVITIVDDGAKNYHARPSPDGRSIAFDSDRDGERGVYVATREGHDVRRVSGDGYAAVPTWSPDSRRLTFVRAEADRPRVWNLWQLTLDTGALERLTDFRYGQTWSASWFPDGRRIAYSHEDRLLIDEAGRRRPRAYRSPIEGRLVRTPAVSPDGTKIVFQVLRDGMWLLDLADGSMRRVLADPTAEEFAWSPDGRRVAYHSRRDGGWSIWVVGAV